jgi:hypothetical protein
MGQGWGIRILTLACEQVTESLGSYLELLVLRAMGG